MLSLEIVWHTYCPVLSLDRGWHATCPVPVSAMAALKPVNWPNGSEDEPWLRWPCDSAKSFELFQYYLTALPPGRPLSLLAGQFGLSLRAVEEYAREGAWRERAEAWDWHLAVLSGEALRRSAVARAIKDGERLRRAGKAGLLGERELDRLLAAQDATDLPGTIAPREALQAIGLAQDIEKECDPGPAPPNRNTGLEKLTIDEIRTLKRLQAKMTGASISPVPALGEPKQEIDNGTTGERTEEGG